MNEDPNDPRKPTGGLPGKEMPSSPSPGGDWTCASSVEDSTTGGAEPFVGEQRIELRRQMVQWGIASGTSLTAVTVAYVPAQVLMTMFVLISIWMGLAMSVYQVARLEVGQVRRRGLLEYLPPSLVEQLTQTSFHEFMVNGTWIEEHQYLLLYFIPGLQREQLEDYVDRLVPRHRNDLHRPGLGHFMGESFMQFLVGTARYEQLQTPPQAVRLNLEQQLDNASMLDESSNRVEEIVEPNDVSPDRVFTWEEEDGREQSATISIRDGIVGGEFTPSDDSQEEEEEEDLAADGQVILDAITSGMSAASSFALGMVSSRSRRALTGTPIRTGLTLGVATVGAGMLGVWAFSGTGRPRIQAPSREIVYSGLLGAGIMYVVQGGIGRADAPENGANNAKSQSSKR